MEPAAKAVLRRCKQYLSEVVQVTDEVLDELRRAGLLSHDRVDVIQDKSDNTTRMSLLLDTLVNGNQPLAFDKFCSVMAGETNGWLERDLQAELRVERGDVNVEEHTLTEAAIFVHRKFGTSKRFSETDKKELSELIATKLHTSRDAWQTELEVLQDRLDAEVAAASLRDQRAASLARNAADFVRDHESQLETHAHDMETTAVIVSRMLKTGSGDGDSGFDTLARFQDCLNKLLHKLTAALNHRDSLDYERQKCLRMLKVRDKQAALDDVVERLLTSSSRTGSSGSIEDKDDVIRALSKDVRELEQETENCKSDLDGLRRKVSEKEAELTDLKRMEKTGNFNN